jgi:hypothetical protein
LKTVLFNHWRRLSAVLGLLVLAACGGAPRLADIPVTTVDLVGEWALDRAASDDVRALLRPMIGRRERELSRQIQQAGQASDELEVGESAGPPPEVSGPPTQPAGRRPQEDDASMVGWLRRQQRLEFEAVIAWLSPASQLKIDKQDAQFRFLSDKGEGTRRFVPGEQSAVFNAFGGFDVSSGWDKDAFVVSSRGNGDNRIRLLETYTLLDGGATLEERVVARLPSLGKHEFRFIYRRRT